MTQEAGTDGCVFCDIARGEAGSTPVLRRYPGVVVFRPLNPVTAGHLLVVPHEHVADASRSPAATALTYQVASLEAAAVGDCNLITSCGRAATQTVMHLHVHLVPRRGGDGLALPWTAQVLS